MGVMLKQHDKLQKLQELIHSFIHSVNEHVGILMHQDALLPAFDGELFSL